MRPPQANRVSTEGSRQLTDCIIGGAELRRTAPRLVLACLSSNSLKACPQSVDPFQQLGDPPRLPVRS